MTVSSLPPAQMQAREKLRFQIVREWRNGGRFDFTDSEIETEISKRLEARRQKADQMPLFDAGQTSRATRAQACVDTHGSNRGRRGQIRELLRKAGPTGLTRSEIAESIGLPPNCVTRPVCELLQKEAFETGETRPSQWGRANAVIALREVVEVA